MDVNIHLERIKHEFEDFNVSFVDEAYKVDGNNGIRFQCGLNQLKAVDYFKPSRLKFIMLEFSDLGRQCNDSIRAKSEILNTMPSSKLRTKLVKERDAIIVNEIVKKATDSANIIIAAKQKYTVFFGSTCDGNRELMVIYAPMHQSIDSKHHSDIARVLDMLKSKLTIALPTNVAQTVQVVEISKLFC